MLGGWKEELCVLAPASGPASHSTGQRRHYMRCLPGKGEAKEKVLNV